jgi:riboflavin synthase
MFTGIITDTTTVVHSRKDGNGLTMTFRKPRGWGDLALGESVATNGVCLTVKEIRPDEYDCYLMPETLQKTSFGDHPPDKVNLERSLAANGRFGGHFVQGHVDCVGKVAKISSANGYQLYVQFPTTFKELLIPKGSITINGVSLTIASLNSNELCVALIPHTLQNTTLSLLKIGDLVNLEFDMLGKYIVNILNERETHANSTKS